MNAAQKQSCELIETTLSNSKAYRKIENGMYVVKQGSTYVMISVVPWGEDRAIVRCVSQLVKGVSMVPDLATYLLRLNGVFRFGAFAYVRDGDLILFLHSILGGKTLDKDELVATIRDVALTADEWDDRIIERFGGQSMQDLLEEQTIARTFAADPEDQWQN